MVGYRTPSGYAIAFHKANSQAYAPTGDNVNAFLAGDLASFEDEAIVSESPIAPDFLGGGYRNNAATIFVTQKHWDERHVRVTALVGELFMNVVSAFASACTSRARR